VACRRPTLPGYGMAGPMHPDPPYPQTRTGASWVG